MARLPRIVDVLLSRIAVLSGGRRRTIGVMVRNHNDIARPLLRTDHRFLVAGDTFGPLYRLRRRISDDLKSVLIIETGNNTLPIRTASLDLLICLRPIPLDITAAAFLRSLRQRLRPGGRLIWVYPLKPEYRWARRLRYRLRNRLLHRRLFRHELCRAAMESGLADIEQRLAWGRFRRSLVITVGRVPGPVMSTKTH